METGGTTELATSGASDDPSTGVHPSGTDGSTSPSEDDTSGSSSGGDPPIGETACVHWIATNIQVDPAHHADVDGDGEPELWVVRSSTPPFSVRGYSFDAQSEQLLFETMRSETNFGFADLDGDGRDDLVAETDGMPVFYAGQPDASLAEAASAIVPSGPWTMTLADGDGDGDADQFRLATDPPRIEFLSNLSGEFVATSPINLPDGLPPGAELVSVRPLSDPAELLAEIELNREGAPDQRMFVIIETSPSFIPVFVASTEPGLGRFVGEVDIDGDGVTELIADHYDGVDSRVEVLHREGNALVPETLLEHATGSAVGDFEGTGERQLLYRAFDGKREWPPRLYRFSEGSDAEVLLLDGILWNLPSPVRTVDYDGDGVDEVYAEGCDLGCYANVIRVVPC